jgi:Kef-type K+ transport system membrane component KefB
MNDVSTLTDLLPVVILLFLGIATAILSRLIRVSPIVGYIALGTVARASGVPVPFGNSTVATLAELGVVFLLFDVGLHFSLKQISERSRDIFAFGPIQVLFATIALSLLAHLVGLEWRGAKRLCQFDESRAGHRINDLARWTKRRLATSLHVSRQ